MIFKIYLNKKSTKLFLAFLSASSIFSSLHGMELSSPQANQAISLSEMPSFLSKLSDDIKKYKECDSEGNTVLHRIAAAGDMRLLTEWNQVAKHLESSHAQQKNKKGQTALHVLEFREPSPGFKGCTQEMNINIDLFLNVLIEYGLNINEQDTNGCTPLLLACKSEKLLHHIEALLKRGADPSIRDKEGYFPLSFFAERYNVQNGEAWFNIVKMMLDRIPDLNYQNPLKGETLFFQACRILRDFKTNSSFHEYVKMLLDKGADPSLTDKKGRFPLTLLALGIYRDKKERLDFLFSTFLEKTSDLNRKENTTGETVLHKILIPFTKVKRQKQKEDLVKPNIWMVRSLLEKGASIKEKDLSGNTFFHKVASNPDFLHLIPVILEKIKSEEMDEQRAYVNERNKDGKTPLFLLLELQTQDPLHLDYLNSLLDSQADVNVVDKNKRTPFHALLKNLGQLHKEEEEERKKAEALFERILAETKDINGQDKEGNTYLHEISLFLKTWKKPMEFSFYRDKILLRGPNSNILNNKGQSYRDLEK